MLETDLQQIELGPGGLIRNIKANEELLEKIRRTDPLPTPDLLVLANYLRKYMTNIPLGDHLELVGLRQIIYKPDVQQSLVKGDYLANTLSIQSLLPEGLETEDYPPPWGDGGSPAEEKKDPPDVFPFSQLTQVTWISFSGVGLLIETTYSKAKDGPLKKHYYVIGVSPKPPRIPAEAQA